MAGRIIKLRDEEIKKLTRVLDMLFKENFELKEQLKIKRKI
jgi:hypothetical protein